MALNAKQTIFVKEYLVDKNATRAAKSAGYSEKTAHSIGPRLLENVEVAAAIEGGLKQQARDAEKRAAKKGITKEKWLAELARIAFSDMDDFATVGLNSINVIPTEHRRKKKLGRVIKKISESTNQHGGSQSIELWNKERALELIGKHFGWVKDVVQTEKLPDIQPVDEEQVRAMREKIKSDC